MSFTILLVEDDLTLRETMTYRLKNEGYNILLAAEGQEAYSLACSSKLDLMLLDIILPGIDGFTLCKKLRACCLPQQYVPILMLTARSDITDKVAGLEIGADDYITKPFSWPELRARIRTQLRRVEALPQADLEAQGLLEIGDLRIDLDQRRVWRDGLEVELSTRLFDLLVYFVRHKGIVLTRSRLLEKVWGYDYEGDHDTINVYIRWLREKIEQSPSNPIHILTVRGVGYRFNN